MRTVKIEIGAMDMSARRGRTHRSGGAGLLALCCIAVAASSWAATTPIYKCLDKNLAIVYTDEPCKDGERLDLRPGEADAAAVARLERQRDALDQSAYQHAAEQRRAAMADEAAAQARYESGDEDQWYDNGTACVANYEVISYTAVHRDPMRHRKTRTQPMRQFAPRPPSLVVRD
jgi:hypothetical protein